MTHAGPDALPQAFFLLVDPGQRFCLFHAPQGPVLKSRVLYLHPFAEEMHASRRVVAQQCRALAADGHAVLQIDLLGCGDSSGDFGDATWSAWVQDAMLALQWLNEHTAEAPTWLWGLRAGALLACNTTQAWHAQHPADQLNLLLWQPVASGQQQLQQFLRLHAAAQWLGRGAMGEPPEQRLAAGQHAHIAGYSLAPTMAAELGPARLEIPEGPGQVVVIDAGAASPAHLSPWIARQQAQWQAIGWQVDAQAVTVTPFWQNVVESSLDTALDKATREALA
ncbi:hydrolase 2, exosortase A system-associated [Hydrogenophaga sp.]|uniref:hydrolase 2, exosortase A system-associated n=1 Tax=Hydrogenophaga sp. TaxID=1904254 RepID=UPI00286DB4EA|nr:hydrolase 2, exosortase A system-associated [Hydrogenophaga sp.]